MVREAETAAELLSAEGISAEVIDLRWLSPLDFETVRESLGRTGRLIIAHEANRTGGFGAEIAARVAEEAFDYLDSPDCPRGHARRADSGGSCAASRADPGSRASGRGSQEDRETETGYGKEHQWILNVFVERRRWSLVGAPAKESAARQPFGF